MTLALWVLGLSILIVGTVIVIGIVTAEVRACPQCGEGGVHSACPLCHGRGEV